MRESILRKQKSNRANQIILGVGLVVIMLISTLGYAFRGTSNNNSNKVFYNDYEFILQNGYWFVNIGNYQFSFQYNPKEVERIDSQVNYLNSYAGKPVYIYTDNNEAGSEVYRNLFYNTGIALRMQSACFESEGCSEGLPIKDCTNKFIIIRESEETNITQNESCVFIEGPNENLTQITDEFLFKVLNID